jgi:hypothetical protein
MAARRLILAMLVLLVLSSIAAALIPVNHDRLRDSTMPASATAAAQNQGRLVTSRVSVAAAHRPTIDLHVGDELRLTVTSPVANQVEIPSFGELEDVDPNLAATFDLLTFDPGKFAVRIVDPPGLVATIDVTPDETPRSTGSH